MSLNLDVPCNGCIACCQRDLIILKPGDNPYLYDCDFVNGNYILQHKKNGDCIYLDRNSGCTIHEHRPIVCRGLDCRFVLKIPRIERKKLVAKGLLSKRIINAARKLRKLHGL
jgi:hypothetical protein